MSIISNIKILTALVILIISFFFSTSVFAQDASSSATPTASPTSSPSSSPSDTPTPSPTATPTPSSSSSSGSATSSPTPTPKASDKVLGAATTLGATGREIDFIKWVLVATVFLISLFIGLKALRSNVKE